MTRDEIIAQIAKLEAANEAAPGWGAAVGARYDEIKELKSALRRIEREEKPTDADRIAELEAENARLRDCREWMFYPVEMPLSADGQGPATVGVDAVSISYEVWDRLLNSYSSHGNLPDAINDAMARCADERGGNTPL